MILLLPQARRRPEALLRLFVSRSRGARIWRARRGRSAVASRRFGRAPLRELSGANHDEREDEKNHHGPGFL